ncbi:MAG: hypothetical protein JXR53_15950 [Bacteroidales bacterium]|nr:hypothetical protein [Bacteroidales bacterium]
MRTATLIILVISFLNTNAQENLVRNGGFEEYLYCPPIYNHDSFPCLNWDIVSHCTPDYYNFCSKVAEYNPPMTINGYSNPKSGSSFIGLMLLETTMGSMEHLQCQLTHPLDSGKKYEISFWLKLAYQLSDYSSKNIGILLSNEKNVFGKTNYWNVVYYHSLDSNHKAQINITDRQINDTNWVKISGIYLAKGGEKYLTLGSFYFKNEKLEDLVKKYSKYPTRKKQKMIYRIIAVEMLCKNKQMLKKNKKNPVKAGLKQVYYFFDDVSVIEIE